VEEARKVRVQVDRNGRNVGWEVQIVVRTQIIRKNAGGGAARSLKGVQTLRGKD